MAYGVDIVGIGAVALMSGVAVAIAYYAAHHWRPAYATKPHETLMRDAAERLRAKEVKPLIRDKDIGHDPSRFRLTSVSRLFGLRPQVGAGSAANRWARAPLPGQRTDAGQSADTPRTHAELLKAARQPGGHLYLQGRDGDPLREAQKLIALARDEFGAGIWVPALWLQDLYEDMCQQRQSMHWTVLGAALKRGGIRRGEKRNMLPGQVKAVCYFIPEEGDDPWAKRAQQAAKRRLTRAGREENAQQRQSQKVAA